MLAEYVKKNKILVDTEMNLAHEKSGIFYHVNFGDYHLYQLVNEKVESPYISDILDKNKKLPIIIDTPLARLDSAHRTAFINKYDPRASDQTIIPSIDVEIDAVYYEKIKKYVGNEFTLIYDEEKKCSTIRSGYFEEVKR